MRAQPVVMERRRSWNAGLRERFQRLEERWNRLHPPISLSDVAVVASAEFEALTSYGRYRPNVLLTGSPPHVTEILIRLLRSAIAPVDACRAGSLALPNRMVGALVIHDAERLGRDEQERLFGWMSYASGRTQVITTTSLPLFPLVVRNEFSEPLFYRLNEVCFVLE